MASARRVVLALAAAALFAGCGGSPTSRPAATAPLEPATFDVGAVRASFTEECWHPRPGGGFGRASLVDSLFCDQVKISAMTGRGTTLMVPTILVPDATDQATLICEELAWAHFDRATGANLGYRTVGVLDKKGGDAAVCPVS